MNTARPTTRSPLFSSAAEQSAYEMADPRVRAAMAAFEGKERTRAHFKAWLAAVREVRAELLALPTWKVGDRVAVVSTGETGTIAAIEGVCISVALDTPHVIPGSYLFPPKVVRHHVARAAALIPV